MKKKLLEEAYTLGRALVALLVALYVAMPTGAVSQTSGGLTCRAHEEENVSCRRS